MYILKGITCIYQIYNIYIYSIEITVLDTCELYSGVHVNDSCKPSNESGTNKAKVHGITWNSTSSNEDEEVGLTSIRTIRNFTI
jgi:hypothetical protein